MIYKIPDELVPYLEYIPEEMLSDVITDALKAAIFAPSVPVQQSQPVTSAFDMSQLLEQIKVLLEMMCKHLHLLLKQKKPNRLQ